MRSWFLRSIYFRVSIRFFYSAFIVFRGRANCNLHGVLGGGKYSHSPLRFDPTWLAVYITAIHACDHPSHKLPSLLWSPRLDPRWSLRRRQNNQTLFLLLSSQKTQILATLSGYQHYCTDLPSLSSLNPEGLKA